MSLPQDFGSYEAARLAFRALIVMLDICTRRKKVQKLDRTRDIDNIVNSQVNPQESVAEYPSPCVGQAINPGLFGQPRIWPWPSSKVAEANISAKLASKRNN